MSEYVMLRDGRAMDPDNFSQWVSLLEQYYTASKRGDEAECNRLRKLIDIILEESTT